MREMLKFHPLTEAPSLQGAVSVTVRETPMTSKAFRLMMAASLLLLAVPLFARKPTEAEWNGGATILCYHIVESPHDPRMEISREVFREQMAYLAMTGYTVVPLR